MQSAVNKPALANKKKNQTEDELMESLENIDMLLANMKAGDQNREQAIHKLGEKYSVFEEQNAKKRLIDKTPAAETQQKSQAEELKQTPAPQMNEQEARSSQNSAKLTMSNLDKLPTKPQAYQ